MTSSNNERRDWKSEVFWTFNYESFNWLSEMFLDKSRLGMWVFAEYY